ncbi:hypothetical protein J2R76_000186 [Bradyrhizobium sp. USDA 4532]|uniref:hypothetical protein n=1 Tax=unclassified Bradyrhizobium TaxID=2631580 RepID=UPI0020A02937|nr:MULTISPECIES: hypothetical protein [unclassified Bradyrhizobium]MCP1831759.1 hypothetical protein [Bradyrhizobium sp. USDA 4545]MCP1916595.1 hypothetical protein [Bradyrhizobium sp. USDA 4532]
MQHHLACLVVLDPDLVGVTGAAAAAFNTITNFNFTNNKFFGCTNTSGALINVSVCSQFNISNNQANGGGFTYFATISPAQDYYVVRGNLSGGLATAGTGNANISNVSPGAHSTVDENW